MSVVITSITRESPAPCMHFVITGTIDGNPNQKTEVYYIDEILTYGDELSEGSRKAFILMCLRRHYELGGNPNQIIGVDLESLLGPPAETFMLTRSGRLGNYIGDRINNLLGRNNAG